MAREKSSLDKAVDRVNEAVAKLKDPIGLPPADKTLHGEAKPARRPDVPHGGPTSDDPLRAENAGVAGDEFARSRERVERIEKTVGQSARQSDTQPLDPTTADLGAVPSTDVDGLKNLSESDQGRADDENR
jgi:hypothetical protein